MMTSHTLQIWFYYTPDLTVGAHAAFRTFQEHLHHIFFFNGVRVLPLLFLPMVRSMYLQFNHFDSARFFQIEHLFAYPELFYILILILFVYLYPLIRVIILNNLSICWGCWLPQWKLSLPCPVDDITGCSETVPRCFPGC